MVDDEMMPDNLRKPPVRIFGVAVDDCSSKEILAFICEKVKANQKSIVSNVNVYALNLAYETPWFRRFLNQAGLNFCDGFGVKLAARILGTRLAHRSTPPDWIDDMCALCAREGFSLYLLGAKPGIAQRAADIFSARHPGLVIAGTHHGYFDKQRDSEENQAVVAEINASGACILIVGFGMPLQERWISENWADLDANIAFPVGAMIDYAAGEVVRAPRWMTDHGLEWLGRLVIEPRRLWKRYILGNPLFIWRVLLQKMNRIGTDD